jgi:hypothetical protein
LENNYQVETNKNENKKEKEYEEMIKLKEELEECRKEN